MKYKQIVFDVDGTLLDTEYAVLHSLQDTIESITGEKPELERLAFVLGITGESALKQLGLTSIPAVLSQWEHNMERYFDSIQVFDHIKDLLEALTAHGYELGIVTSKTRDEFVHDFCVFGIEHLFRTVVCSDDTSEHKPNPAPILKYIELTQCGPEDVLYIGDSVYDMECAAGAGVDFALAGWGVKRELDAPVSYQTPLDARKHLCSG